VLFVLYLFRIAAIATYILCGFFTDNYVVSVRLNVPISSPNKSFISSHLQTVIVVILLAMDFWNCRVGSVRASLLHPLLTAPIGTERCWTDSRRSTVLESGLESCTFLLVCFRI
jgi:hypothetical protein